MTSRSLLHSGKVIDPVPCFPLSLFLILHREAEGKRESFYGRFRLRGIPMIIQNKDSRMQTGVRRNRDVFLRTPFLTGRFRSFHAYPERPESGDAFLYICLLDFVDQGGNGLAGYFLNVFTNDSQHGETIVDETGIAVADHADIGRYAAAEP